MAGHPFIGQRTLERYLVNNYLCVVKFNLFGNFEYQPKIDGLEPRVNLTKRK